MFLKSERRYSDLDCDPMTVDGDHHVNKRIAIVRYLTVGSSTLVAGFSLFLECTIGRLLHAKAGEDVVVHGSSRDAEAGRSEVSIGGCSKIPSF